MTTRAQDDLEIGCWQSNLESVENEFVIRNFLSVAIVHREIELTGKLFAILQDALALRHKAKRQNIDIMKIKLKNYLLTTVLAVAAIANPETFFEQLTIAGAAVIPRPYPDHHTFSAREARDLAAAAEAADFVVCTLKDAVKLGPLWPPQSGSLWYVSQRVCIEEGGSRLDEMLDRICY